jgi:hypothetical protein
MGRDGRVDECDGQTGGSEGEEDGEIHAFEG